MGHHRRKRSFHPFLSGLVAASLLWVGAAPAHGQSRADELAQQQAEKNKHLRPNEPGIVERALNRFEENFNDPDTTYQTFGGVYPSAGFAPGLAHRTAFGHARLDFGVAYSVKAYKLALASLRFDPALDAGGTLTFANAAVAANVARAPASYEAAWFAFDNGTRSVRPIGQPAAAKEARIAAPGGLPASAGSFVRVDIKAIDPPHPSWQIPVHAYFKLDGSRWTLVGFERLPDGTAQRR